jgi:hypothetical protein
MKNYRFIPGVWNFVTVMLRFGALPRAVGRKIQFPEVNMLEHFYFIADQIQINIAVKS